VEFDSLLLMVPSEVLTKDSPELREYADRMLLMESEGEGGCGVGGAGVGAMVEVETSSLPTGLRGMLIVVAEATGFFDIDNDGDGDGDDDRGGRLGRNCGGGGREAERSRFGTAGRAFEKRERPAFGFVGNCSIVIGIRPMFPKECLSSRCQRQ
jgi:hypothetical protein